MKWTDNDMMRFAEWCGEKADAGFVYLRRKWLLDDANEATTSQLLEEWKKMQIPSLPTSDDLKDIKLGPQNY